MGVCSILHLVDFEAGEVVEERDFDKGLDVLESLGMHQERGHPFRYFIAAICIGTGLEDEAKAEYEARLEGILDEADFATGCAIAEPDYWDSLADHLAEVGEFEQWETLLTPPPRGFLKRLKFSLTTLPLIQKADVRPVREDGAFQDFCAIRAMARRAAAENLHIVRTLY